MMAAGKPQKAAIPTAALLSVVTGSSIRLPAKFVMMARGTPIPSQMHAERPVCCHLAVTVYRMTAKLVTVQVKPQRVMRIAA